VILTVASFKGGVGKTTSAIHFAAWLQTKAPTLLLDGDPNRQALRWARHDRLPFKVADIAQAARFARDYTHTVIDTAQRQHAEDFRAVAEGCDLLVVPTVPGTLDTYALTDTVAALRALPSVRYRVLLVKVAPSEPEGAQLRQALKAQRVPLFRAEIPKLKAFERAAAQGVLVADVTGDPRAVRAGRAYAAAGKEILA
jgi:chromosome partitioning protein